MKRFFGYARQLASPGVKIATPTITVYDLGTLTPSTLYADDLTPPPPRANPFTGDANGFFYFYATDGRYDVRLSGGTPPIPSPYTWGDVQLGSPGETGPVFNVKDAPCRAVGDGVANDTAAIQCALDAAAAAGGGTVYFPKGVYLVAPAGGGGSGQTILTLNSTNLHLQGAGIGLSTLRVAPAALPYKAIVGPLAGSGTDLSHLTVSDLTFDHSIANNPIVSGASIAANPQFSVFVFAGTDITYRDLEIVNASSINNLVANGATVKRVAVLNCRFSNLGDDPNHVSHDASIIYLQATLGGMVVANNQFASAGPGVLGASTAIETHGPDQTITGNVILDFFKGMNVTGIAPGYSPNIVVTGNTIRGCSFGIHLWPYIYPASGQTAAGLDGLTVTGNVVTLAAASVWAAKNPVLVEGGILFVNSSLNLDANNVVIADNVITHPLDGAATYLESVAIGWLSSATVTLRNARIANNVVVNFPACGLRIGLTALEHVAIEGNTFVNCGSTTIVLAQAYRSPLFISATTQTGVRVVNNHFVDALTDPVNRPNQFCYLFQDGATVGTGVEYLDNSFCSTGSAMTQQILLVNAGGGLLPYLRGAIANFVPSTGANQKWALGSQVVDPVTGQISTIQANQYTWLAGLLTSALTARVRRLASAGSSLIVGDIAIVGWGAGASVQAVGGTDSTARIQVVAGTAPSALPTIAWTWKDGTWTTAPTVLAQVVGGSGALQLLYVSANATTITITYNGTPVDTKTYVIDILAVGT